MRLWTRVFLLSASVSVAAVAIIGVASISGGRASIMQSAVQGLLRDKQNTVELISQQWVDIFSFEDAAAPVDFPDGARARTVFFQGIPVAFYARKWEIEIRSGGGDLYFASGRFSTIGAGDRPEIVPALHGETAYVLRRQSGALGLYLCGPARINDVDLTLSVACGMDVLDSFMKRQLSMLLAAAIGIAAVCLAASFLGSRAIARRLERLARGAAAIADGDYGSRVDETGRDEVGELARQFNRMARTVETTVGRLRTEKEDRQRFIDSLTHELRTPATTIVGFAQLLSLRSWDAKVFANGLARIQAEGRRVLELMESLSRLLLSRVADRSWPPVEMAPCLRELAESVEDVLRPRALAIRVDADPGSLPVDPQLVATAMRNLVENSARVSPPGSTIIVGFRNTGSERGLFVRDFGPGMPDAERARAGQPFFRGAGARRGAGFGLGLAICREIAASLGATLVLEQPPGGGLLARIAYSRLQ
jgi:signal transduction histidine kinase